MPKKAKPPSFEESIERLEDLVQKMEEESLPLETLLSSYEEGHELLQNCQALIDNARERIEVIQIKSKKETENKLASNPSTSDNLSPEAASDDSRLL